MSVFTLDFVIAALVAAGFTGLAAPAVGTYLVQRRLALMGDGIGHVAVTGIAIGLLTGTSPIATAIIAAVLAGALIEAIRSAGRATGDVALALLFYGGIAGGVLITGLAGQSAAVLNQYLFGSVTSISPDEVRATVLFSLVVVAICVGLAPQLFAVAQDPEFAQVSGLNVRLYNMLIAVLAAVTVTVAMRTVGLLLVSALMVVPVAAAQQLTRSFRTTLGISMLLGVVSGVGGLAISAVVEVAPGATIVLVALTFFALAWPIGELLRRRRGRQPEPHAVSESHPHVHDADCGHPAILHGDHIDYLHDGHRHAPHGEHYDEH